jgi:GT2 family glycosyltransferase
MISKLILNNIGGYAFNKKLIWREDSDLDNRIRVAGINIIHVPCGVIYHHVISLKTDLRSTFRYGVGLAIANALDIKLTEVPRSTASAFKSKGVIVALYMLFRNRVYNAGYIYARVRLLSKAYLDEKINR